MPKRKLPTKGGDSSLQPAAPPSTRSSSRKRISDVFKKLADACNKHSAYHQTAKSFARLDEDEDNLPEKCRKDLVSVRALLPKVEKCFPLGQAKQCDASDVVHLCDFYERVLLGVYCPHAPALLQWGKVPNVGKKGPSFPFLHCLLAASQSILAHSSYSSESIISPCPVPIGGLQCECILLQREDNFHANNCEHHCPSLPISRQQRHLPSYSLGSDKHAIRLCHNH
eukprot:scaffold14008_cov124-Cylindrotheca_fusiformis.AAC.10